MQAELEEAREGRVQFGGEGGPSPTSTLDKEPSAPAVTQAAAAGKGAPPKPSTGKHQGAAKASIVRASAPAFKPGRSKTDNGIAPTSSASREASGERPASRAGGARSSAHFAPAPSASPDKPGTPSSSSAAAAAAAAVASADSGEGGGGGAGAVRRSMTLKKTVTLVAREGGNVDSMRMPGAPYVTQPSMKLSRMASRKVRRSLIRVPGGGDACNKPLPPYRLLYPSSRRPQGGAVRTSIVGKGLLASTASPHELAVQQKVNDLVS